MSAGAVPHLRDEDERHVACWGAQQLRPGDPARGHLHRGERRRRPHLRGEDDGTLACWGQRLRPVHPAPGTFRAISAGGLHSCAIKTNGTVACWGNDYASPLFAGTFAALSAGGSHTCAVEMNAYTLCWGSNSAGQSAVPESFG